MTRPSPHVGRSIMDIFWQELDDIMDWLKDFGQPETFIAEEGDGDTYGHNCAVVERDEDGSPSEFQEWAEKRGQAQGVAYCLAVLTNPYAPNIDAIRTEARTRWEKRNDA